MPIAQHGICSNSETGADPKVSALVYVAARAPDANGDFVACRFVFKMRLFPWASHGSAGKSIPTGTLATHSVGAATQSHHGDTRVCFVSS
jgi:hypothetical protein